MTTPTDKADRQSPDKRLPDKRLPDKRSPRKRILALIVLATIGVGIWRFTADSISFGDALPYVERAVERAIPGASIEIGDAEIRWGGWNRGLDLEIRATRVRSGGATIEVPDLLVKLSLRALLRGQLAPTQVEIVELSGKLVRDVDGRIRLISTHGTQEQPVSSDFLERLLDDLATPPTPTRPFSYLRSVRLRNATIRMEDLAVGTTSTASEIDVDIYPAGRQVAGEFRAQVQLDDENAEVGGSLDFDGATRNIHIQSTFIGVQADALVRRVQRIRDSVRLRSEATGQIDAVVSLDGELEDFALELEFASGLIAVNGWLEEPTPFESVKIAGRFGDDDTAWTIDEISLDLRTSDPSAEPRFEIGGTIREAASGIVGELHATVTNVDVPRLKKYWPEWLEEDTRKWVTRRIHRGFVAEARATASVTVPNDGSPAKVSDLVASFPVDDLTVKWHDIAPAATGVGGTAQFRNHGLVFELDRGRVDELEIAKARVGLIHLNRKPGTLTLDLEGSGPVYDGMRAIDLTLPDFIKLGPDDGSTIAFRGKLSTPLVKKIELHHLDIAVDGRVEGLPIESDLGVGRVSGDLRFESDGGQQVLHGDVNLADVESDLRFIAWSKTVGEPARGEFVLKLDDGKPVELASFAVEALSMKMAGAGRWDPPNPEIRWLHITDLDVARTQLARAQVDFSGPGLRIHLEDGDLDMHALFTQPKPLTFAEGRSLSITANNIERLHLAEDGWLQGVEGRVERSRSGWEHLSLRANVPWAFVARDDGVGRGVTLSLTPDNTGHLNLDLQSDDFGGLLAAGGWLRSVKSGTLRVTGSGLGKQLDKGHLNVDARAFSLSEAPLAVRLLSLASLNSIVNVLQNDRLFFQEMRGSIRLDEDAVVIDEIRGHGSSLGWTAAGRIDTDADTLDLKGTVIPAYAANRVLTSVPVLRELLVGEGILAVDYTMKGALDNPDIGANPLSALTPEMLRGVFGGG